MVTIIDMTTGELVYQTPSQQCEASKQQAPESLSSPGLALQEISLEPERHSPHMPPELGQLSINEFLTRFE